MKGFEISVRILGVPYRIICDEQKLSEACEEEGLEIETTQGLHVAYDLEDARIYVSPLLSRTQFAQTLFHEVLHAIGYITGHESLRHSVRKNEHFVDAIATGLVSFLANEQARRLVDLLLTKEGETNENSEGD
jgi:hypothetical protein